MLSTIISLSIKQNNHHFHCLAKRTKKMYTYSSPACLTVEMPWSTWILSIRSWTALLQLAQARHAAFCYCGGGIKLFKTLLAKAKPVLLGYLPSFSGKNEPHPATDSLCFSIASSRSSKNQHFSHQQSNYESWVKP